MDIKNYIRDIPNFPKSNILFKDITPLLKNPAAFEYVINSFYREISSIKNITAIVAIESRGFIFGSALALKSNLPLILIRKAGKLPSLTHKLKYELEYGSDTLEIHQDSLNNEDKIIIIDDLIATGGTIDAACKLVKKTGAEIIKCLFLIELLALNGKNRISSNKIKSLIKY